MREPLDVLGVSQSLPEIQPASQPPIQPSTCTNFEMKYYHQDKVFGSAFALSILLIHTHQCKLFETRQQHREQQQQQQQQRQQ